MIPALMSLIMLFSLGSASNGEDTSIAGYSAFSRGDYPTAIKEAAASGSPDALALACRSHVVLGGYFSSGNDAVDHLHTALGLCEQAIALDPRHLVARMTYAMAAGFEGKRLFNPGYAAASRKHLEYLADIYPDDPMTIAAVGGWHSEIHAAGFFARVALGGSRKTAEKLFNASLEMGVPDIPLYLEYIKFLARGGKKSYPRATEELTKMLAVAPQTEFDRLLQERAVLLQDALKAQSKRQIRDAIDAVSAFQGIEDWDERSKYTLKYEDAPETDG